MIPAARFGWIFAAAAFLKVAGRPQSRDEEVPTEEDGVLSTEVSESMLKWHAEAIGRCVELSAASDMWVFMCFICLS